MEFPRRFDLKHIIKNSIDLTIALITSKLISAGKGRNSMKYFIGYLLAANLAGFLSMIIDKRCSVKEARRISERMLLFIAAAGGSIGSLTGMYLVRHKTKKRKFTLGIPLILFLQAAVIITLFTLHRRENTSPSAAVRSELDLISELDDQTISSFIDYQVLTGSPSVPGDISDKEQEAAKAVHLFFQNFRYEIASEHEEGREADVIVTIRNLDTRALAHDLRLELISSRIDLSSDSNASSAFDLNDYFALLSKTLSSHQYDTVTTHAAFHLNKEDGRWIIDMNEQLQDEIVGGFGTNLTDPDLLEPDEVLSLYLEKYGELDADGWMQYLGMDDFFATGSTSYASELDRLYAEKIAGFFDWKIGSVEFDGENRAHIKVTITSFDLPGAAGAYREKLTEYAKTTDSITSGSQTLSDKTASLFIEAINENDASADGQVTVTMTNEEGVWHPDISRELTNAFLGDLESALEILRQ